MSLKTELEMFANKDYSEFFQIDPTYGFKTTSYVKNGKNLTELVCRKCNHTFLIDNFWVRTHQCPVCGNVCSQNTNNEKALPFYRYVEKIDNGYAIVSVRARQYLQTNTEKFVLEESTKKVFIYKFGKAKGHAVKTYEHCVIKRPTSIAFIAELNKLSNNANSNMTNDEYKAIVEKITNDIEMLDQKTSEKKKHSNAQILRDIKANYQFNKNLNYNYLNANFCFTTLYDSRAINKYKTRCVCGNIYYHENREERCPICNNINKKLTSSPYQNQVHDMKSILLFEATSTPDESLCIRMFDCKMEWNVVTDTVTKDESEVKRIFMSNKKIEVYEIDSEGKWIYSGNGKYLYKNDVLKDSFVQSMDEIEKEIAKTSMRYSGIAKILRYNQTVIGYNYFSLNAMLQYVVMWQDNNALELVCAMPELVLDFVFYKKNHEMVKNFVEKDATNLKDALRLPTNCSMKLAQKYVKKVKDLNNLRSLAKVMPELNEDRYKKILDENLDICAIINILDQYDNISFDSLYKYLENAYNHQCIEKNNTLAIWKDYLYMASRVKYDLSDKNRLYPTSLKKEHDIVMFAYNAIKEQLDKEEFRKNSMKNKKYEFKDKNFVAIIPTEVEEVVKEATRQHNCLRSYISRIKNNETVVAFVRRNEDVDKNFITAEIHNDSLVQFVTAYNASYTSPELRAFVKAWSQKVGFEASRYL